jgi:hypothetical protein
MGIFFRTEVARLFRQAFSRGSKVVNPWPYNAITGVVDMDPNVAAKQAGVNLDTICLAAMLSSEHGNDPQEYKEQIAFAAINEARARGVSVSKLLLTAKNARHAGKFGAQADIESGPPFASDRYASTKIAPHEDDMAIASLALSGLINDYTEGARQFDSPKAQDALYASGKYSLNADGLAAKRMGEGKREVNPEGINPRILRFWV